MSRKNELVPKLRFAEFRGDKPWEERRLGEIADVYQPKTISQSDLKSSGYLVYGANGVIGRYDQYNHETSQIAIACRGSSCGTVNFTEPKSWITGNAMVINVDSFPNIEKRFIYHQLSNSDFGYLISGSGQPQITGNIKGHLTLVPSLKEQQKIADCLSSLDKLVNAENQKLEALQLHKKGLMQQLFPAEGERVPRLRFKEFRVIGEWVQETFDQLYSLKGNNSFSRDDLNYENGHVKNIHYGDIHTKFSTHFDIAEERVPYVNADKSIENIDEENYCLVGDMVFADASEDLKDVGKSIEIVNINGERLVSGMHTILARQKESKLVIGLGGHIFLSAPIRVQIQKEAQGSKVLGVSGSRLANIKLNYPINKVEQRKIVDFLSSLDILIKKQRQKIECLNLHKRGLTQQLFPNADQTEE